MRTLHFLIVFLLCVHHILSESFVLECHSSLSKEEFNDAVRRMNQMRSSIALEENIANMYEIEYDRDLEKIAKSFKSCDDYKHGDNYRVRRMDDDELYRIWKEIGPPANRTLTNSELQSQRMSFQSIFHPLMTQYVWCNTSLGCTYTVSQEDAKLFDSKTRGDFGIYISGPISKYHNSDFKFGKPASQCPDGKSSSYKHLCKAPSGPKPVYGNIESENKKSGGDSGVTRDGASGAEGSADSSGKLFVNSLVVFLLNYLMFSFV